MAACRKITVPWAEMTGCKLSFLSAEQIHMDRTDKWTSKAKPSNPVGLPSKIGILGMLRSILPATTLECAEAGTG